jgi:hypothetical protein
MYTLELTSSQMLMLKKVFESDMFLSEQDMQDYTDEEQLMYYLDRCRVYNQVLEEMETGNPNNDSLY